MIYQGTVIKCIWISFILEGAVSRPSSSLWRQGGKRKESLQLRPWNLNSISSSPVAPCRLSCQISANQGETETSANVNKHVPRVMTSLLISSPPISILHRLFRSRYSNSRDVDASSPSFSHPAGRARRRACSQTTILFLMRYGT